VDFSEEGEIMPRGGSRKEAGRRLKWGEPLAKIGVPSSISNDLISAIEYLWEKGMRGKELTEPLHFAELRRLKKYDYPVSAGANRTSNIGGESIHIDYEDIDLFAALIPKPSITVVMPVIGDSMTGIGIYPGDWLIVEEIDPLFQKPQDGDIIVAAVNDETLVKRYKRIRGKAVLLSENVNHEPIEEVEGSSIYITGIVRSAIRRNLSSF
jgi:DNA polymerase V